MRRPLTTAPKNPYYGFIVERAAETLQKAARRSTRREKSQVTSPLNVDVDYYRLKSFLAACRKESFCSLPLATRKPKPTACRKEVTPQTKNP